MQVNFVIQGLSLDGSERILDLAYGFGRHSLELASRGFETVGVDITAEYIRDAESHGNSEGLQVPTGAGDCSAKLPS